MTITKNTLLNITETKRGKSGGIAYQIEAGKFIDIVKAKDANGILSLVEPIEFDEDGEAVEFSADKFWELPIEEQLEMCCSREGDALAAHIRYMVAA
jgi:hypothetical protein